MLREHEAAAMVDEARACVIPLLWRFVQEPQCAKMGIAGTLRDLSLAASPNVPDNSALRLALVAADARRTPPPQDVVAFTQAATQGSFCTSSVQAEEFVVAPLPGSWASIVDMLGECWPTVLSSQAAVLCRGLARWAAEGLQAPSADDELVWVSRICRAVSRALRRWSSEGDVRHLFDDNAMEACADLQKTLRAVVASKPQFSILLNRRKLILLRCATECLCVLGVSVFQDPGGTLEQVEVVARQLLELVEVHGELDVLLQAEVCQAAWHVCTIFEYLETYAHLDVHSSLICEVALVLGSLCRGGPLPLRASLMPCVGFLVRGRPQLLYSHPSLFECLRSGLSGDAKALRARTAETVAWLIGAEEEERRAVHEDARGASRTYDTVGRLADLQGDLLRIIGSKPSPVAAVVCSASVAAASALLSLLHLSALGVAEVVPRLIALALAAPNDVDATVGEMLRQLAAASPSQVVSSLVHGVHLAASSLLGHGVGGSSVGGVGSCSFGVASLHDPACDYSPGESLQDEWRFTAFCDVFAGPLRAAGLCEALLGEAVGLLRGLSSALGPRPRNDIPKQLCLAELAFGILAALPLEDSERRHLGTLCFQDAAGSEALQFHCACPGCLTVQESVVGAFAGAIAIAMLRGSAMPPGEDSSRPGLGQCAGGSFASGLGAEVVGGDCAAFTGDEDIRSAFTTVLQAFQTSMTDYATVRAVASRWLTFDDDADISHSRLQYTPRSSLGRRCSLASDGSLELPLHESLAIDTESGSAPPQSTVEGDPTPVNVTGDQLETCDESSHRGAALEAERPEQSMKIALVDIDWSCADWKVFTPAQIHGDTCMARTWAGGVGGQCSRACASGSDLCGFHRCSDRWRIHGRVDGEIPAEMLAKFRQRRVGQVRRARAAEAAIASWALAAGEAAIAKSVAPHMEAAGVAPASASPTIAHPPKRPIGEGHGCEIDLPPAVKSRVGGA